MIAVFGATGKVGGKVAAMLLESGVSVRALARSAENASPLKNKGAEIIIGSLQNENDIKTTLEGCDGAFLITPKDNSSDDYLEGEIAIGRLYGDAVKEMDVGHVVYLSVINARDKTGIPFFESKAVIEDSIVSSGADCTFLRAAYFMENLYKQSPLIQQFNMVSLPLPGDVPIPMAATEDIAYAAVQSLNRGGRGQEAFDILGPRDYTMFEAAEIISRITGRGIRYQEATYEQAEQTLRQAGMSAKSAQDYLMMFDAMRNRLLKGNRGRVYDEFNYEPTPLETVMGTLAAVVST